MTYDEKCHDLALYFLQDHNLTDTDRKAYAHELAQRIQQAVEDCYVRGELPPPPKEHVPGICGLSGKPMPPGSGERVIVGQTPKPIAP